MVQKEKDWGKARSHMILNFSWIICMLMLFLDSSARLCVHVDFLGSIPAVPS